MYKDPVRTLKTGRIFAYYWKPSLFTSELNFTVELNARKHCRSWIQGLGFKLGLADVIPVLTGSCHIMFLWKTDPQISSTCPRKCVTKRS